jgi:hypothetical protein
MSCLAQIGQSKEQLSRRYGKNLASPPLPRTTPNKYDGVLDVGDISEFHHGGFEITALFKGGLAQSFYYRKLKSDSDKTGSSWESSSPYLRLTHRDIFEFLHAADPVAEWIPADGEPPVKCWRTSDGSKYAYYYADGSRNRYMLCVQTAAVDAVWRKVERDRLGTGKP